MAIIFNWREVDSLVWPGRFESFFSEHADIAVGGDTWRHFVRELFPLFDEERVEERKLFEIFRDFCREIRAETSEIRPPRPRKRECVFVSHQKRDVRRAEDIAHFIDRNTNCNVWLDVWDPQLQALNKGAGGQLPKNIKAVLIAMIIELALWNSTRVLAIMTDDAKKSRWVPYEYGRVRGNPFQAQEAAAWIKDVRDKDLAEYMLLGPRFRDETELKAWFI